MTPIRLRLDPWPGEYESPFQVEGLEEDDVPSVRTDVEGIGWRAVEPQDRIRPDLIHFIDGVRRIDARIIGDDGTSRINYGVLGSIAVGAVRVERASASFERLTVKRFVVLGNGVSTEPQYLRVGHADLVFEPHAAGEGTPNAPVLMLQELMRREEAALAQELATTSGCTFADGPLTYFSELKLPTIGIIKRIFKAYLSETTFPLVGQLSAGQRTPVFYITEGKYDRYSWYLRVRAPRPMDYAAAGVMRLEVRSGIGLERAVELADASAACIPSFAGDPFRDPRSPQNLLPIGALEQELRHRMGDRFAVRRAIESKLFEENGP